MSVRYGMWKPVRKEAGGPSQYHPKDHVQHLEIAPWVEHRTYLVDEQGHRQVVRNGYADPRTIVTGVGPIEVKRPRAHDHRSPEVRERFMSNLLPPHLRKAKAIDELIPWLYLKGISTGGFAEAFQALLGPDCQPARSIDSPRSGRRNKRRGPSVTCRTKSTSTSGPMASTSTSA